MSQCHVVGDTTRFRRLLAAAMLTATCLHPACTDDSGPTGGQEDDGGITTAFSAKQRAVDVQVSAADTEALVDGNTDFTLRLYQALRVETDENLFFSPYSISLALAMAYAGARGETEQQMAETLGFTLARDDLHAAFNALDQALASRGQQRVEEGDGTRFELNIANAIWGQRGFEFLDGFLDVLAENYGAGMRLVDFVRATEESRGLINDWVAEQTEDRIVELIPEGAIDAMTRLVLTNAIYFNASWLHPFEEEQTADGRFALLDGSEVTAPMMHQSVRTAYAAAEGYQAVELPYIGHELSMVVVLPDAGEFAAFEATLDAAKLSAITAGLGDTQVTLTMPRFEFESAFGLADALKALGMTHAFTPPSGSSGADFTGMYGSRDLYIQDVLHEAFVSVDERGTEAAAATAVLIGVTSMPQAATMTVDRPFLCLIRDRVSGTVLFIGRVMDPTA